MVLALAALAAITSGALLPPSDPAAAALDARAQQHLLQELGLLLSFTLILGLSLRGAQPRERGHFGLRWDPAWARATAATCALVFPLVDPLLYGAWGPAVTVGAAPRCGPGRLQCGRSAGAARQPRSRAGRPLPAAPAGGEAVDAEPWRACRVRAAGAAEQRPLQRLRGDAAADRGGGRPARAGAALPGQLLRGAAVGGGVLLSASLLLLLLLLLPAAPAASQAAAAPHHPRSGLVRAWPWLAAASPAP
jgi:hypothetical protein